jgi:hypothetical protein
VCPLTQLGPRPPGRRETRRSTTARSTTATGAASRLVLPGHPSQALGRQGPGTCGSPTGRGCRYAPRAVPGTKGRIDKGVRRRGDGLWDTDQYGDWVDPKSPLDAPSETTTAKHRVAHAFLVHRTQVALGQGRQAAHYDAEHEQLGQLVDDTWIINGSLANRTHTRRLRCRTRAAVAALQPCVDLPGHALRGIQSTVYSYALLLQTTVPRGSTTHTDTTFVAATAGESALACRRDGSAVPSQRGGATQLARRCPAAGP